MMKRKAFVFNLEHSPVSYLPSKDAKVKILPKVYAQVVLDSVYFTYECGKEDCPPMPVWNFEGPIEMMFLDENSEDDFFCGIKKVFFPVNARPRGCWRYEFNDDQIADIAACGWFRHGCEVPPEFWVSRIPLEMENIQVLWLNPNRKKGEAPILRVGPADFRINRVSIEDMDLTPLIIENIREHRTEFDEIFDAEIALQAEETTKEVNKRKENAIEQVASLTEQQLKIRRMVKKAETYAQSVWDDIDSYRAAHSVQYRRELEAVERGEDPKEVAKQYADGNLDVNKIENQAVQTSSSQSVKPSESKQAFNSFLNKYINTETDSDNSETEAAIANKETIPAPFEHDEHADMQSSEAIKTRNDEILTRDKHDDAAQAAQERFVQENSDAPNENDEELSPEARKERNEERRKQERQRAIVREKQAKLQERIVQDSEAAKFDLDKTAVRKTSDGFTNK